jgi:hypothetical protein
MYQNSLLKINTFHWFIIYCFLFFSMPLPNTSPRREGQNGIIFLIYPLLSCLAPPKRLREGEGRRGQGEEVTGNRRRLLNSSTFKTIL